MSFLLKRLNFPAWKGINDIVSQDADSFVQTLSSESLRTIYLFLSRFFIRWLTLSKIKIKIIVI